MRRKIAEKNTRYQGQIEAILEQMKSFSEEQLNRKPGPERWSAAQTMHHLILTEEMGLRYVQKKLSFATPTEQVGLRHRLNSILLKAYWWLPIKVKAPAVVGSDHLPEHASLEETKLRWLAIRQKWSEFLDSMPDSMVNVPVFKHPLVDRLSWAAMLDFNIDHLNHHFKQIIEAANGRS